MKLSIKRPASYIKDDWQEVNKKIINLLTSCYDLNKDGCNWLLNEFLTDGQCKDIAVIVFGNDFPSTVEFVKFLRIVGDGQCPNCGSDDCEYEEAYPDGEYEDDEYLIFTSGGHSICNTCNVIF